MDIVPYNVPTKTSTELILTNGEQPLLQFVDLIIRYAKETGDFGQYTSLNILSSELGDTMVNTISKYKKAAMYENKYLMEDIILKSASNITDFIESMGEFLVCDDDLPMKKHNIEEMGRFFVHRYNEDFFENVKRDTFDIENERIYWEEIKYKLQSIFQKNMNFMINKHKQNALPWYKRLFITDTPREETNSSRPRILDRNTLDTRTQQRINRMCVEDIRYNHVDIMRYSQMNNTYTVPRGITTLSKVQNRRFC